MVRSYLPSLGQSNRDREFPVSAKRRPSFKISPIFTWMHHPDQQNTTLFESEFVMWCASYIATLLRQWTFLHAKFCLNIAYVIALNSHIAHIKYSIEISPKKKVVCFDIVPYNLISLLFWFDQLSLYNVTSWKLRSMLILGKMRHWFRILMLLTTELQFIWKDRFTVLSA